MRVLHWWQLAGLSLLYHSLSALSASTVGLPSAASFYVPTLPDLHNAPPSLQIFAGHLPSVPLPAKDSLDTLPNLYFVLTKARRSADRPRLVFWFNGGPGCSSFDGLMMEVGPWRVDGKGGLEFKEGGWEEYAHIVYVDQPAGTGFSYTPTNAFVHELTDATTQLLTFLEHFYSVFPEYRLMDTYLAGESFAGQYIPYFANALLNSSLPSARSLNVSLKGIAIGNGWIDGKRQYPSFLQYALKHGLIKDGSQAHLDSKKVLDECTNELTKQFSSSDPINTSLCERVLPSVLESRSYTKNDTDFCTNIYDVRLDDTAPACGMNWPPDLADIKPYLQRPDVVDALHANKKPKPWVECAGRVHAQMTNIRSQSSHTLLPGILEKIQVLLFAGDQDFICNYVGIENTIAALTWSGSTGLGTVKTQSWTVNDTAAGTWVSARNLTYAKIFNASHMVGFDVPHVAHDMMLRFMGVDFSALGGGTAGFGSSVGGERKPSVKVLKPDEAVVTPPPGSAGEVAKDGAKTPEMDKAMWEAYYNAGSAAIVLVLVLAAIGVFFWCRRRRARGVKRGSVALGGMGGGGDEEESIPLREAEEGSRAPSRVGRVNEGNGSAYRDVAEARVGMSREGKGKARAVEEIFEVGDSDEDEEKR